MDCYLPDQSNADQRVRVEQLVSAARLVMTEKDSQLWCSAFSPAFHGGRRTPRDMAMRRVSRRSGTSDPGAGATRRKSQEFVSQTIWPNVANQTARYKALSIAARAGDDGHGGPSHTVTAGAVSVWNLRARETRKAPA